MLVVVGLDNNHMVSTHQRRYHAERVASVAFTDPHEDVLSFIKCSLTLISSIVTYVLVFMYDSSLLLRRGNAKCREL